MSPLPLILSLLSALLLPTAASAQTPFYKGKTIRIVISTGVAGGYAEYARLLADHMPRHIAGPAEFHRAEHAGRRRAPRRQLSLQRRRRQDGTTIGIVHSSVPLTPLWGNKGVRFDTLKFNWLGSLDRADGMCIAWAHLADQDLGRHADASSSPSAAPAPARRWTSIRRCSTDCSATKIKVIAGYKDGTDVFLAMERGEIDGRCGGQLTVIKSTRPWWLTEHKISVPIVIAEKRSAEFPDTPTVMEFVHGRADPPADRPPDDLAGPRPPGDGAAGDVPAERVKELRDAFDATVADPAFRADVDKKSLHVDPVRGEEMTTALKRAFALPVEVIAGAKELMGGK